MIGEPLSIFRHLSICIQRILYTRKEMTLWNLSGAQLPISVSLFSILPRKPQLARQDWHTALPPLRFHFFLLHWKGQRSFALYLRLRVILRMLIASRPPFCVQHFARNRWETRKDCQMYSLGICIRLDAFVRASRTVRLFDEDRQEMENNKTKKNTRYAAVNDQ